MDAGSYQLLIELRRDARIEVGALGGFILSKGLYVYTGSAMRNLAARVARHLRTAKKLRWHIDYLLSSPEAVLIDALVYHSETREECLRNRALIDAGAWIPVPGFGSSDCRSCPAHLVGVHDFQNLLT